MFAPAVHRLYSIDVRIEQDSRFVQVKHGADAPNVVSRTACHNTGLFNIVLKKIGSSFLFSAQRRDAY
jgi:hypothetical protein